MTQASTIFTVVSPLEENAAEAKARPRSEWDKVSWVCDMRGFFLESLTVCSLLVTGNPWEESMAPWETGVVHGTAVLWLSEGEALFVDLQMNDQCSSHNDNYRLFSPPALLKYNWPIKIVYI